MTLYERDLAVLDPHGVYPRGIPAPFSTQNGVIYRPTLLVLARLMAPNQVTSVGGWFREYAVVQADTPILDEYGVPVLDHLNNATYVDDRLSGMGIKSAFFCATGKHDT